MSQNEHMEKLIDELVAFDPSLKEHEGALRAVISEFSLKRPDITPDPAFVNSLRARILLSKREIPSPYAQFNFWAVRLAPLGAFALLLLILAPQGIFEEQSVTEKVVVMEDASQNTIMNDVETGTLAPGAETYRTGGGEALDTSISMKSLPVENQQTPSPLVIYSQEPGMSITIDSVFATSPSYVVIYSYLPNGQEQVVGVSPLVLPGTTNNIPVYLRAPTRIGEMYTATLHADNGNRVFTRGEDMPIIDGYGNPVQLGFDIVPRYSE